MGIAMRAAFQRAGVMGVICHPKEHVAPPT